MDTTLGVLLTQQCACGTIYARLHPWLCGIAYPLSDMEPSHCVAANALLPLSVVGSAMLQPRHPRPLFLFFFFVSLRFSLARRQCPFLGTFWKGANTTTTYVFSLTFVPPPIIMDQCQLVTGYFFWLFILNSLLAFNTLKRGVHLQKKLPLANSGWPGRQYFSCCCIDLIFAEGRGFSAAFPPHVLLQSSHFPIDSLTIPWVRRLLAFLELTYMQWRC